MARDRIAIKSLSLKAGGTKGRINDHHQVSPARPSFALLLPSC